MPFDGSGNFAALPPPDFPAVAGEVIYANRFNAVINDLLTGLAEVLPRDGQAAMAGDLQMGSFKLTNMAAGTTAGNAIEYAQWLAGFANPAFTGVPTAPTAAPATNTTQIATTAFVHAERTNAATLTNKTLTAPVVNSPTGIVKGDVGLGNVDNTSDLNKPVSTAQQAALNLKQDLDADLTALAALGTTGIITRTGAGTFVPRALAAGAGIAITDADGVAGPPTIAITASAGLGDVTGPGTATDGDAVLFDGATGKVVKSLGAPPVAKTGDTMTGPLAQAAGSAALPSYTFSGSTGTGVWRPAANTWAVSTAGVERLRIDASGNVGVGATPSANVKLDVNGTIKIGTGTAAEAGVIFSDVNWGMLFRAFQTAPTLGDFAFYNSAGVERARIDSVGNLLVTGSGGLGYGVGAGGTVTQATNKSTDVTLNKPCGMITTHAENSPAGTTFAFFLKSTAIAETDSVIVQAVDGLALFYTMRVGAVSAPGGNGQVGIYVTNVSGAARAEAVRIRFAIIKGTQS